MLRFNNRAAPAENFSGGGSPPNLAFAENRMSVDISTVKRRVWRALPSMTTAERMTGELNAILGFVEQLNEVNVDGIVLFSATSLRRWTCACARTR